MNADMAHVQRIGRLMPLADVLAMIEKIPAVAPREIALAEAAGRVLAADIVAPAALPGTAVALRDGWAVDSEATRDAGPYAPVLLEPQPQRVDAFEHLPPGTDAVAPLDAVSAIGGTMQMMAPVAPGEGVLPPGVDAEQGAVLRKAGTQLRAIDVAAVRAAGLTQVQVRAPRIRIHANPGDAVLNAAAQFIADAVQSVGAVATLGLDRDLDAALRDDSIDALIVIGGTGSGYHDRSVTALSRIGTVACHGIGLLPGDTAAFGRICRRPVLLMPGRIDAVLACWLVLGRTLVNKLSGATEETPVIAARLSRKVTSTIGMAEVIPVRHIGNEVEPLASGYLSLQSLTRADGWMLVPAASEGYPAGTEIQVRALR